MPTRARVKSTPVSSAPLSPAHASPIHVSPTHVSPAYLSTTPISAIHASSIHVASRLRFIVPFVVCLLLAPSPFAQENPSKRRIVTRSAAVYPALARHMALSGLVKVDALVSPDGTVKAVEVKGGHPVLAQAASNTIRQWKWEPSPHESHEQIEIRFTPPE
ncbi:MAG: energy transducer TonB [Terriglobales bacterium]